MALIILKVLPDRNERAEKSQTKNGKGLPADTVEKQDGNTDGRKKKGCSEIRLLHYQTGRQKNQNKRKKKGFKVKKPKIFFNMTISGKGQDKR